VTGAQTTRPDEPVDLDAVAAVRPAPRHRLRYRTVSAALAVGGLLAGALLAGIEVGGRAGTGQLLATLDLRGIVLSNRPVAVLVLTLLDVGDAPVLADEVAVSGAGLVPTTRPLARTIRPDVLASVSVEVPLSCTRQDGAGLPARAFVTTRPARGTAAPPSGRSATTEAAPVGRLMRQGGLCSAADEALPAGWQEQATATSWSSGTDGILTVDVAGLPANVSDVFAIQADGVIVPVPDAPVAVRSGTATLRLGVPGTDCQAVGTHPLVPTGLQLLVHSDDISRFVYVPVDLAVADWMMQAFVASCPQSPGGPSAVRPLLGG
jgi:hypothetical protein